MNKVCVDSRQVEAGDIFFALPGAKTDGHKFVEDVLKRGAREVIVRMDYEGDSPRLTRVKDPLMELQRRAKNKLEKFKPKIVAVTGSVGKTTTKDFIQTLLQEKFKVAKSPGNANSQMGLPLTILNHYEGQEVLVLEMGMTHKGNIRQLVEIAAPDIAVLLNVELVHACNFDSLAEIAQTKSEIFESPTTQVGFLYRKIDNFNEIRQIGRCRKVSFDDEKPESDGMVVNGVDFGPCPVLGRHNRLNAIAAIHVALECGLDHDQIRRGVARLQLPEQRLQLIEKRGVKFVNDSYNACEVSMKAAMRCLPKTEGKTFGVLGGMAELGKFSEGAHRNVGLEALQHFDEIFCFGEECLPILQEWNSRGRPVKLYNDHSTLIEDLRSKVQAGDVVLLKGSRTRALWKVVEEI